MEPQKPYIGKAILRKKNKAISIMFPDTTITLLGNRYIAQWNSIESSEVGAHLSGHLIFVNTTEAFQ